MPTYHSKTSRAKHRGKVGTVDCTKFLVGVVVAYWIDYGFARGEGPAQWRFPRFFSMLLLFDHASAPDLLARVSALARQAG